MVLFVPNAVDINLGSMQTISYVCQLSGAPLRIPALIPYSQTPSPRPGNQVPSVPLWHPSPIKLANSSSSIFLSLLPSCSSPSSWPILLPGQQPPSLSSPGSSQLENMLFLTPSWPLALLPSLLPPQGSWEGYLGFSIAGPPTSSHRGAQAKSSTNTCLPAQSLPLHTIISTQISAMGLFPFSGLSVKDKGWVPLQ